jgi:hypothetical protein
MDKFAIFRVVIITDGNKVLPFTNAISYCTPYVRFWLASDCLDDPATQYIIGIRLVDPFRDKFPKPHPITQMCGVNFEWDGGTYHGYFASMDEMLAILNDHKQMYHQRVCGIISSISSL